MFGYLIKIISHLFCMIIIFGCSVNEPKPKVIISSDNIKKRVVFEERIRGGVKKIQLTNFYPFPGAEIAIIGQDSVWFLSQRDYKKIEGRHFRNANGETIWIGLNPELLDVNSDGIYEIMQGGGGYGKIGLLDSKGNTLWSFQPDPKLSPNRMIFGDLNNDKTIEFYVADNNGLYQLNDKGSVIWKVNSAASHKTFFYDVKIFIDKKTSKIYLITVIDNGVFQIYDYNGKKIKQFSTGFHIYNFEIVEWKEKTFILAGYFDNKAILIDLYGKVNYRFDLGDFPSYHSPQGKAVKLSQVENEYMVLLAHSSSSLGLTQLNIFSPDCKIIYQEIIRSTKGFMKIKSHRTNKENFIIGDGCARVIEYSMIRRFSPRKPDTF